MTIPVTTIHILRLLLQAEQNLSGLQRDMRNNALSWQAMANAQSVPLASLAQYINDAATMYQTRLAWIATAKADTASWTLLSTMWGKIGGAETDFNDLVTPLTTTANSLGPADKSSYAAINTICNNILAAINAPLSLWPE